MRFVFRRQNQYISSLSKVKKNHQKNTKNPPKIGGILTSVCIDLLDKVTILCRLLVLPGGAGGILSLILFLYEKVCHRTSILEASFIWYSFLYFKETSCEAETLDQQRKIPICVGIFQRVSILFAIEDKTSIYLFSEKAKFFIENKHQQRKIPSDMGIFQRSFSYFRIEDRGSISHLSPKSKKSSKEHKKSPQNRGDFGFCMH